MTYDEAFGESKVNFYDKVNVISGFPGIGKTVAKRYLKHDTCFGVLDFDSGTFKVHNPGITSENWVEYYVKCIQSEIESARLHKALKGPDRHTTYIILVSSHLEVRQALSDAGIEFYYIRPDDESMADHFRDNVIMPRINSENEGDKRSVAFARKMVEKYANGGKTEEPDISNQTVIELHARRSDEDEGEMQYTYLLQAIYELTSIPFYYRTEHTLDTLTSHRYRDKLIKKMFDVLDVGGYGDGEGLVPILTDVSITSDGYPYLIFAKKNHKFIAHRNKFMQKANVPRHVVDFSANIGSSHIVLSREKAQEVYDLVKKLEQSLKDATGTSYVECVSKSEGLIALQMELNGQFNRKIEDEIDEKRREEMDAE